MVITDLICRLNELNELDNELCMMAKLGSVSNRALFVDIFGNSNGLPTIYLSDDTPPQSFKKCAGLLRELERWVKESIHYQYESNVYLANTYDYDDGSYDYRYFKLVNISKDNGQIFLIGDEQDCESLREHFDAFDESMFDPN